jgi:hypothetical protein
MASPVQMYQDEMFSNLGFYPTWLPGDRMEIGDVGVLDGGRFRQQASLKELGIAYQVSTGTAVQNVKYNSTQGTKIEVTASADAASVAQGEIKIEFARTGAFVFHANDLRQRQLENRLLVGKDIVAAYARGTWKKEWLLVEAHHIASCATVIVCQDSAGSLVLGASASKPLTSISLSDPKVGLTVSRTSGRIVHLVGARNLHPLYSCLGLRDPVFGKPVVEAVRGVTSDAADDEVLIRPGIAALLES